MTMPPSPSMVTFTPGSIDANAGICNDVRLQPRDDGSLTVTFVSTVFPAFVTVILNLAVPPTATDCFVGFFTIAILGAGAGVTVRGSQGPVAAG